MVFEKVKEIIVDTISCAEDQVKLEVNLKEDLGIDSLDATELSMALEEEYGITIEMEELQGFVTVQNIVDFITEKTA